MSSFIYLNKIALKILFKGIYLQNTLMFCE